MKDGGSGEGTRWNDGCCLLDSSYPYPRGAFPMIVHVNSASRQLPRIWRNAIADLGPSSQVC